MGIDSVPAHNVALYPKPDNRQSDPRAAMIFIRLRRKKNGLLIFVERKAQI